MYDLLIIQPAIALWVVALALLTVTLDWQAFRPYRRLLTWVSRRRGLAICFVGATAFTLNAALSNLDWPIPTVHDEFAYLLGADTFARGRLTNPTHPMWEHFESFHIIHQPTYQMKYPPGQSLVLAAGQLLGDPAVGLWLGMGMAASAVCWMLYGYLPPRWALLGGCLVLLNFGFHEAWGQTYWGGALAMCGGALVFGSIPRLIRRPSFGVGLLLGLGVSILANTRPYEGLVAVTVAGAASLVWIVRSPYLRLPTLLTRGLVPAMLVVSMTTSCMIYYNWRITGNPLKLPYFAWQEIYSSRSIGAMMIATEATQSYRPIPIHQSDEARRRDQQRWKWLHESTGRKLLNHWCMYFHMVASLAFVVLPCLLKDRRSWLPLAGCTLVILAVLLQQTSGNVHYSAPVAGLFVLLLVQAMRHLRAVRVGGTAIGASLCMWIPIGLGVCFLLAVGASHVRQVQSWSNNRDRISRYFTELGDRHLLIVRYSPRHSSFDEWVYNGADIDSQPVVWARELSPQQNLCLLEYFSDRQAWLVEADANPPQVVPYPDSTTNSFRTSHHNGSRE